MLEIRQQHVMIQRWDLSCGAAALGTLLQYGLGERVTEKAIAAGLIGREEYVRNPKLLQLREGFSLLDLKRYVQSFHSSSIKPGVFTRTRRRATDTYPASLPPNDQPEGSLPSRHRSTGIYKGEGLGQLQSDDLIQRAPVIVPINSNGYNHFVVFRGVIGNRVLLADPAWGNRTMTIDKFQRMWLDYGETIGHVGFVITRTDRRKIPNKLEPRMSDVVMLR
jgi:predicted double-glycine peptidase